MKRAHVTVMVVLMVVGTAFHAFPAQAQYGGGSGTPSDPYLIYTATQMNAIGADSNDWDKHFKLMADVNLAGQTYSTAVIAPGANPFWGFQGTAFTGVFDGNGCKITGLMIDDGSAGNDYLGLFGYIDNGEVRNLGLEGCSVSGDDYVGGLAGINHGRVSNCYSTGYVSGYAYVGGLVGLNRSYGSLSNCHSTGDVDGDWGVGGLVGLNRSYGSLSNCHSTGDVDGGDDYVGSLLGANDGSVSNCYSTGDVNGDWYIGGLVGANHGSVSKCFWNTETQTHGVTDSIGLNDGTVTNVAGLPTAQMQTKSTFISAGWDFVDEAVNGTSETWQMPAGGGYPALGFFDGDIPVPLAGNGNATEPYLIGTAQELGMVNWYPVDCCFKLTSDIDLSGINWSVPVVPVFSGCFDGDGHKLANMQISGGVCLGLFGYLGKGGRVRNLGLEGGSVSGVHRVGGLVGVSYYGSLSNCYSTGDVSGVYRVGGLVGLSYDSSSLSNCYSISDVNGTGQYVGGLVGVNSGSSVSNCFWDTEMQTHGVTVSIGDNEGKVTNVEGLPTADMQTQATFISAGWDFTTPIWTIDEGNDYPRLWWESPIFIEDMKLTPRTLNCNSKGKYIKAHFVLPEEFLPEDVDVNKPAWAEPMGAESESIRVFGNNEGPVKLEICFDREAFCDSVTETGEVEVTVIGSLTTSRYFYATDTIRIKPQR